MLSKLGNFLEDAIRRSGAKTSVEAHIIVESAGAVILQIIPELKPSDIRVEYYKAGTLAIGVVSPIISQELKIRQEAVLEALRETFRGNRFDHLKFMPLTEPQNDYG